MTPLSCKYNKVAVGKYIELFQPSLVSQNNFDLDPLYRSMSNVLASYVSVLETADPEER